MSTKRPEAEALKMTFKCSCGKILTVPIEKLQFSYGESECDLCGSHGALEVNYLCEGCNKWREAQLKEW
jgi:hypothetical protein